jgi:hypothetical protein
MELELDSEKRNHAETIKILRKKERTVKEIVIQCEEDQKNVLILQEHLEKANAKLAQYKRQLNDQVNIKGIVKVEAVISFIFYSKPRRASHLNQSHVSVAYNASWRLPKNVPKLPKAT